MSTNCLKPKLKTHFFHALKPIYVLCRICGICPYSINLQGNELCFQKNDVYILIWHIFVFAIYILFSVLKILHYINNQFLSSVDQFAFILDTMNYLLYFTFNMSLMHFYRKDISKLYIIITDIQNMMECLHIKINYYNHYVYAIKILLFFFCWNIILLILNAIQYTGIAQISFYISQPINDLILGYMMLFIYDVKHKYSEINLKIKLINCSESRQELDVTVILENIIIITDKLNVYKVSVNKIFNIILLTFFCSSFFKLISTSYFITTRADQLVENSIKNYIFIRTIIWIIYFFSKVTFVVYLCNGTTKQVIYFLNILLYSTLGN